MHKTPSPLVSSRRDALKTLGAVAVTAMGAPAFAQNTPIRIGVITPRGGVMGTVPPMPVRLTRYRRKRLQEVAM